MTQDNTEITKWNLREGVTNIPLLTIGASSVCFILGLLVVNLHLAQYGIYSAEIIRTEYILAGATIVLLVTIVHTSYLWLLKRIAAMYIFWREKSYFAFAASVFVVPTFTLIPLFTFLMVINRSNEMKPLLFSMLSIVGIWAAIMMIVRNIEPMINEVVYQTPKTESINYSIRDFGAHIFFLFLAISLYVNSAYANISKAYGGGKIVSATLYPTTRGLEICKALALPILQNQTVGPVSVLTESSKELVVLIPDNISGKSIAIRLNVELFDAIQIKSK